MLPFGMTLSEGLEVMKPVSLFIISIVIYSMFIFHFYKFLARKDVISLNLNKYNKMDHAAARKIVSIITYLLEYIFLFPIFVFFWFAVLAALLSLMIQQPVLQHTMMLSIALVAAVRITAYYDEDLSKDIAKMLPFALLGVFIVEMSFSDYLKGFTVLKGALAHWRLLLYYLGFMIGLEFVLRILYTITHIGKEEPKKD